MDEHGVHLVAVPWARPGSGFTLLFEALLITFAAAMPGQTDRQACGRAGYPHLAGAGRPRDPGKRRRDAQLAATAQGVRHAHPYTLDRHPRLAHTRRQPRPGARGRPGGIDGMFANSTKIYRANIHRSVDGIQTGSDVLIQDSYLHGMSWFASDPNLRGAATHNGGVQSFLGDARGHAAPQHHRHVDDENPTPRFIARPRSPAWMTAGCGCALNFNHVNTPLTGYLLAGRTTAARPGLVEVTGGVALSSAAHRGLVWLSSGMRPAGHRGAERLKRGLPSSK